MEIVGGFMVMMSIIGLFLAVVWLIMPFVVFAIKGKQDRTLEVLESIEKRLAALEAHISAHDRPASKSEPPPELHVADPEVVTPVASDASTGTYTENM
jgi:hypothetical protein